MILLIIGKFPTYLYSFTINYKNNPDNDDQNFINQKLNATKLAYQIVESVIEER